MHRIFWGFGNTWHPNNMKRKYYYYTVHIGALPVPVCGIIAYIDQISIQLNGFIYMYVKETLGFWECIASKQHLYTVHSCI